MMRLTLDRNAKAFDPIFDPTALSQQPSYQNNPVGFNV